MKAPGASGFRGVTLRRNGKWQAKITYDGECIHLGTFIDANEAKKARLDAEMKMFGRIFDRSVIELHGDHAKVPLHSRSGELLGWAEIDIDDVNKVEGVSWFISEGYAKTSGRRGSRGYMHRWILFGGGCATKEIDHKDGNRLNNRRANLRECSRAENNQNLPVNCGNTSGTAGVSLCKKTGRWAAYINVRGKRVWLGRFSTRESAFSAREAAKAQLHHFQPIQRSL